MYVFFFRSFPCQVPQETFDVSKPFTNTLFKVWNSSTIPGNSSRSRKVFPEKSSHCRNVEKGSKKKVKEVKEVERRIT